MSASKETDRSAGRLPRPESGDAQQAAILKLLNDDDPAVTELVIEQLVARGGEGEAQMEVLLDTAEGRARKVLQAAHAQLSRGRMREALRQRCHSLQSLSELEDFCWKLSLWNNPLGPVEEAQEQLERWGEEVRRKLTPGSGPARQLEALVTVLVDQENFTGNTENYYETDNSFLDAVVFSREGIPISLCLVYILVGDRAGIKVEGVGMPGHFLARIGSIYFDPFHHAGVVERSKLEGALEEAGLTPPFSMLDALPFHMVAQRMILNLINVYERAKDDSGVEAYREILEWLQAGD